MTSRPPEECAGLAFAIQCLIWVTVFWVVTDMGAALDSMRLSGWRQGGQNKTGRRGRHSLRCLISDDDSGGAVGGRHRRQVKDGRNWPRPYQTRMGHPTVYGRGGDVLDESALYNSRPGSGVGRGHRSHVGVP